MKKKILKTIRLKNRLSQSQIAKILKISIAAISAYERGERIPKKGTAYKYIDLALHVGLKITLEDIYPRR